MDWWKIKQLGKNQILPTGFTDTVWQSGHTEEYCNLGFQSLAQEHLHIFSRAPPQFFLTEISNTLQLQPLPPPFFWLLNTLLILTFSFFPINCQSLAISHHSCAASSAPRSTLSLVRQAKEKRGKKKKSRLPGDESAKRNSCCYQFLHSVLAMRLTAGKVWEHWKETLSVSLQGSNICSCVWAHMIRAPCTEVQRIWRTDRWRFSNQCSSFIVLSTCL